MGKWTRVATVLAVLLLVAFALAACAPAKVAVPDLSGKTTAQADAALSEAKLVKGEVTEDYSGDTPAQQVFKQTPAAGAEAEEGSKVSYVVSLGEPPAPQVSVPDVKGLDLDKATSAIEAAGLSLIPYDEFNESAKKGTAFGQLPEAGSERDEGSEVFVAFSLGKHPTNTKVPGVTGKKEADAVTRLKKDGFKVKKTSLHVVGVKKAQVVAQVPARGDKVSPGSAVIIMVSSGSPDAKIPDVAGLTQHKASVALEGSGFAPTVYSSYDIGVPLGRVITQMPAKGAKELHGSEVAVVVSLGEPNQPPSASTPDVSGMTRTQAQKAIAAAGLKASFVDAHDSKVKKGSVVSQHPRPGDSAVAGQDMVVSISAGPLSDVEKKVPSVKGKSTKAARDAMSSAGLRSHTLELYSSKVAKGKIMGQLPASGDKVLRNARVTIVTSLGKPPALDVTVPDVGAKTEADATTQLEKLGLEVAMASRFGSEAQPPGTVTEQFPLPGALVKSGSKVVIVIIR